MSSWNYRVCVEGTGDEEYISIREVYYNVPGDDSTIWAVTGEAVAPIGDSVEGLNLNLERMLGAFNKPIINLNTIKYAERK